LLAQRCEAKSYRMLDHGQIATDVNWALISRTSGTMYEHISHSISSQRYFYM
jgi:hypothetical protein